MEIVKDWTTLELIEFLNSYKMASQEEKWRYRDLMVVVSDEIKLRQPLIGVLYA